jgi:hypothetical protein
MKSKELFGVTLGIGDFEQRAEEVKPTKPLVPYLKSKLRLAKKTETIDEEEDQGVKRLIKPSVPTYRKSNRPLSAAFPREEREGDSLKTMLFSERMVTPATMAPAPNFQGFTVNRPSSAFPKTSEPNAALSNPPTTLSKSGSVKLPLYKPGKTLTDIRKYEQAKEKAQHTVKQWLEEADQQKQVQVNKVTETMKKLHKEDLKIKQDIADIMKRFQDRRASVQHAVTRLRTVLKTKGQESETQLTAHEGVLQAFKTELKLLYNDSAQPILKYPQLEQPVKSTAVSAKHPWVTDLEAVVTDLSAIEPNMQFISDDESFEDVDP